MCINVCATCMLGDHVDQRVIRSPGTGQLLDGCELPHEFWELHSTLLQKQVLLTAEPSP